MKKKLRKKVKVKNMERKKVNASIPQKNKKNKFIWFDLVTPKSVLFFRPLIKRLENVIVTTRIESKTA